MGTLPENAVIDEFLKMMAENGKTGQAQDFSQLYFYADSMLRQVDAVLQELQTVKQELADVKSYQPPVKKAITGMVQMLENKLNHMREKLHQIDKFLVEYAGKAVQKMKQTGIFMLEKTASTLHVKKAMEAIRNDLSDSIKENKRTIQKIEAVGKELRSIGGHVKNTGRVLLDKNIQNVDGGKEGLFQSGLLAPMRTTQKIMSHMNNATLAAIGNLERLEQTATELRESLPQKKQSIRKDLSEKRDVAAARPVPDKEQKTQEAAL